MAYSFKTKGNIGSRNTEYSRYYSNFRGVDFSSDHTQVHENRLAYLVNMYKDYQSGQGEALETIPGFRRRAHFNDDEVYGIFYLKCLINGATKERVLVHSGTKLYLWHNYPYTFRIPVKKTIIISDDGVDVVGGVKQYTVPVDFVIEQLISVKDAEQNPLTAELVVTGVNKSITITTSSATVGNGSFLETEYYEGILNTSSVLHSNMNNRKSASFICNNKLYIIDGKNFLVYDGATLTDVGVDAYVPTTYIGVIPSGENADIGKEYEPRNMLSHKFKTTFKATGDAKDYFLNESALDSIDEVWVYGRKLNNNEF
mgnify:CR=1 FL=1